MFKSLPEHITILTSRIYISGFLEDKIVHLLEHAEEVS